MRRRWQLRAYFFLMIIALVYSGCTNTKFPENPPQHSLLQAIEAWPDEYYWLVETGVSSRVLGIRQPGDTLDTALGRVEQMLDDVKRQWDTLSSLQSAQAITDHLNANNLVDVAQAVQKTLDANQGQEPSTPTHAAVQAHAIKQGLIGAHRKIKQRRG